MRSQALRRGATTVEMTLVGIPIIFILISIFEVSRGMWMYHTLAYAAKNGSRLAIVHGQNCINSTHIPNNCPKSINDIAAEIKKAAVGIDPSRTKLSFRLGATGGVITSCYLGPPAANPPYGSLPACSTYTDPWPTDDGLGTYNAPGKRIQIDIITPFASALAMFWPGSKPVNFALANFGATAADYVQF
jgi:hypothetical protein